MAGGLGAAFRDAPTSVARRQSMLERQLAGLVTAVTEARGRLDDTLLDEVDAMAGRAAGRHRLSSERTVIAIAGATGSGKSTTFNALAGVQLSESGAQRPTTSVAKALVWGDEDDDATEILTWLGVPDANRFHRAALSPVPPRATLPDGLILLDLPDHDSVATAHHREAERVVQLADVLIWVVDPQKYADAAIHSRFLRPLAGHRAVTLVVMNQIDTVAEEDRPALLRDLRKVLVADGLRDPRTLGISARSGLGVDELRTAVRRRVEESKQAEARTMADIAAAVDRLTTAAGDVPRSLPDAWISDLERRIADAAGVPGAAARLERSTRAAGDRSTVTVGPLDAPAASAAVRSLADQVCRDLTGAWGAPVRTAATGRLADLTGRLDAEFAALRGPSSASGAGRGTMLGSRLTGAVSIAAAGVLLLGSGPVAGLALLALGALLLVGGQVAGKAAVRRAAADDRAVLVGDCERMISRVAHAHVVDPVQAELASYHRFRAGLDVARVTRSTR